MLSLLFALFPPCFSQSTPFFPVFSLLFLLPSSFSFFLCTFLQISYNEPPINVLLSSFCPLSINPAFFPTFFLSTLPSSKHRISFCFHCFNLTLAFLPFFLQPYLLTFLNFIKLPITFYPFSFNLSFSVFLF